MTSMFVRRACELDVPDLTQIRNDGQARKVAYRDYAWGNEGEGVSGKWMLSHVSRREVYVVELGATQVGMFSLDLEDEQRWGPQEPNAVYVHGLSVRKGFNGRGIGGFMLDWCADKVSGLNRRYVRLDCPMHNEKLCAYYEGLGFIRSGSWQEPGPGGYVWALYEKPVHSSATGRP